MTCSACGKALADLDEGKHIHTAHAGWRACTDCLIVMVNRVPAEPTAERVLVRGLFAERPETCRHGRALSVDWSGLPRHARRDDTVTGIVFGEVDPRQYIVPESECMGCRHPVNAHRDVGCRVADCDCARAYCWLHDAIDEEHDCDAEGEL